MADLVTNEKATLANTGTITDDEAQMLSTLTERKSAAGVREAAEHSSGQAKGHRRTFASKAEEAAIADAESAAGKSGMAKAAAAKEMLARMAVDELDDSDELEGSSKAYDAQRSARAIKGRFAAKRAAKKAGSKSATALGAKQGASASSAVATAEASRAAAAQSAAAASQAAASSSGAAAIGAAGGAGASIALGSLAAIAAFVIGVLIVSNLVSALFGFWENEANKQSLDGLPPYITYEMVEAALECQEKYGHPAGCTLAQIIVESGQGETMSRLATRDHNLFGMKWAGSFAGCPEVAGKSAWVTSEEYTAGAHTAITAYFTVFKSDVDCIKFRSRVFLQAGTYANNATIREAMEKHDSELMAEGLKDAGWATSSTYVESLKSVMDTYGLRRFDTMTVEDLKSSRANANTIVAAAYSQLGVPYVWGGSTPGRGLDCSGLTQYCYRQAGIAISHYTESQYSELTHIPLSQAQPGDILYKPGHVAIYIGENKYIHEPHTGAVCCIGTGINYFTCALRKV